jgi:hypothetical protein
LCGQDGGLRKRVGERRAEGHVVDRGAAVQHGQQPRREGVFAHRLRRVDEALVSVREVELVKVLLVVCAAAAPAAATEAATKTARTAPRQPPNCLRAPMPRAP